MKILGNLIFTDLGDSEIKNAIIERLAGGAAGASLPADGGLSGNGAGAAGRIVYNTDDNKYYVWDGTSWSSIATGGDAAALQEEVDRMEAALGLDTDGTVLASEYAALNNISVASPFTFTDIFTDIDTVLSNVLADTSNLSTYVGSGSPNATSPSYSSNTVISNGDDLTTALGKLDAALDSSNELLELADVTLGSPATDGATFGLTYNAAGSPGSGDRWTVDYLTFGDLNNVASGVDTASNDDVLAFDGSQWTAITPSTFAGDIVLHDIGDVTGSPATDNDLLQYNSSTGNWEFTAIGSASGVQAYDAALDNLSSAGTGIVVSNGDDTFAYRSLTNSDTNTLTITNANGTGGNIDIAVDATIDGIAALSPTADQMIYATGADTFAVTTLTASARGLLDDASEADMRTTLGLVAGGAGDIWVEKAGDTMTGDLTITNGNFVYNNVTDGYASATNDDVLVNKAYVDALTAGLSWKDAVRAMSDSNITLSGAQTIDGVSVVAGDRVLVTGQTSAAENGIYVVAAGAWTRATDMDEAAEFDGAAVFVKEGTTYESTGWTQVNTVTTVDTDSVSFSQFSGNALYTWGTGLGNTGNTVYVNFGAGITELPNDAIGIDLANGTALALTPLGSPFENDQLTLNVDESTLTQVGGTLKIAVDGVTATEINADVAGAGLVQNGTTGALDVNVDDSTIEISTDTVQVKAAGITETHLNASVAGNGLSGGAGTALAVNVDGTSIAITTDTLGVVDSYFNTPLSADSGSDTLSIGDTLTVSGSAASASTLAVSTSVASDTFTITASGATSNLTDVTAASSANGQVMVSDGTNYTPRQVHYVGDFTGSPIGTTWTVSHNLGQRYVNVTVVDSNHEVIIPESITLTDANTVTVTFNTAVGGYAIVTGVAGVSPA